MPRPLLHVRELVTERGDAALRQSLCRGGEERVRHSCPGSVGQHIARNDPIGSEQDCGDGVPTVQGDADGFGAHRGSIRLFLLPPLDGTCDYWLRAVERTFLRRRSSDGANLPDRDAGPQDTPRLMDFKNTQAQSASIRSITWGRPRRHRAIERRLLFQPRRRAESRLHNSGLPT